MNQLPAWLPAVVRDAHGAWFVTAGVVLGLLAAVIIVRALTPRGWRGGWLEQMECPICGYSMVGTASLRCPECGHVAASDTELLRTRRRPMTAAGAAAVLFFVAGVMLCVPGWRKGGLFHPLPTSVVLMLERAVGVGTWSELTRSVRSRHLADRVSSPWQLVYMVRHHEKAFMYRDRWPRGVPYRLYLPALGHASSLGIPLTAPTRVEGLEAGRSNLESHLMPAVDWTTEVRLLDGRLPLLAQYQPLRTRSKDIICTFYIPITLVDSIEEAMMPVRSASVDEILRSSLRLEFLDVTDLSEHASPESPLWHMYASVPFELWGEMPSAAVLALRVELLSVDDGDRVLASSRVRRGSRDLSSGMPTEAAWMNTRRPSLVDGDMSFFRAVARGERDAASLAIRITPDEMGALTAFGATAYWDGEIRLPLMPTIAGLKRTKKVAE